jgi:hypothetical protein
MFFLVCLLFPVVFLTVLIANHFAVKWNQKGVGGWRGKLGVFAERKSSLISGVEVGTCLLSLALLVVLASALITGSAENVRVPIFLSNPGEASQEVHPTQASAERQPRYAFVSGPRIVRGRVTEIMPVGGGLRNACISFEDYCGLADSTLVLNVGDTAYIHLRREPAQGRYGIIITAQEARSLAGTGRYQIEDH